MLNVSQVEKANMLMQKEEFSHTAYATNAYVALGTGSRFLLQGRHFHMY
jgi:hypothetical protein